MHDFSPWTMPNGLFWIVKVPDNAVQISPDGNTLTIHLENVPVVDAFIEETDEVETGDARQTCRDEENKAGSR
jgi:hypothetical protein